MNMPILAQTIQVADKQTSLIQYKSVPVMTTEQMAEFYGTDSNNIKVNHSRNAARFTQGKHYFKVEGSDLRDFKDRVTESNSVQIGKNASSIILWTEKGAARHAKILDTDQAWDVYEQLEEVYFAVKEKSHFPALPNFADPAEAAIAWANEYKAKQQALADAEYFKATKAEIGNRREATAMGRLSAKTKEVEKLKARLDRSTDFATIKKVQALTGGTYDTYELRRYSKANQIDVEKAEDANYGSVNSYHKDAWLAVYNIDLLSIGGEA
jgi:hypothetical protein